METIDIKKRSLLPFGLAGVQLMKRLNEDGHDFTATLPGFWPPRPATPTLTPTTTLTCSTGTRSTGTQTFRPSATSLIAASGLAFIPLFTILLTWKPWTTPLTASCSPVTQEWTTQAILDMQLKTPVPMPDFSQTRLALDFW